jgi:hypothetical protein
VRRDLLLGPIGRLGSIVNIVFCGGLLAICVVAAMTVHPMIWAGVAICGGLEIAFITIAIVVRRFGIADRGNEMVRRFERRHSPEEIG